MDPYSFHSWIIVDNQRKLELSMKHISKSHYQWTPPNKQVAVGERGKNRKMFSKICSKKRESRLNKIFLDCTEVNLLSQKAEEILAKQVLHIWLINRNVFM